MHLTDLEKRFPNFFQCWHSLYICSPVYHPFLQPLCRIFACSMNLLFKTKSIVSLSRLLHNTWDVTLNWFFVSLVTLQHRKSLVCNAVIFSHRNEIVKNKISCINRQTNNKMGHSSPIIIPYVCHLTYMLLRLFCQP